MDKGINGYRTEKEMEEGQWQVKMGMEIETREGR